MLHLTCHNATNLLFLVKIIQTATILENKQLDSFCSKTWSIYQKVLVCPTRYPYFVHPIQVRMQESYSADSKFVPAIRIRFAQVRSYITWDFQVSWLDMHMDRWSCERAISKCAKWGVFECGHNWEVFLVLFIDFFRFHSFIMMVYYRERRKNNSDL